MNVRLPASVLLNDLLIDAPAEEVTLAWLMESMGDRSFGIIMLLLAFLALMPGASLFVGVLLAFPAFQMVVGRHGPVFPQRVASRRFRTSHLSRMLRKAVPVLRYLERFIHPRWPTPFDTTKRLVGVVVLLLGGLLLAPVPLSNIPPALVIMLISIAYLEEDGVLLCLALVAALLLLAVASAIVWETMSAAGWVEGLL
jgi:hypothetical protein